MYVCKTMRLCSYLLENGFAFERTEVDKFNPKFIVWLFKSTPELWVAITEYSHKPKMKG